MLRLYHDIESGFARAARFRKRVSVRQLQDVIFAPPRSVGLAGGLYPPNSNLCLRDSTLYRDICDGNAPASILQTATIDARPSLYLGVIHSCWGHTITDSIKFLWPLLHPERHSFLKTCQFVYAPLVPGKGLSNNMRKILTVLRKYSMPNAYQLVINAAKDLQVVYVDSYLLFPCLWENPSNRSCRQEKNRRNGPYPCA